MISSNLLTNTSQNLPPSANHKHGFLTEGKIRQTQFYNNKSNNDKKKKREIGDF
jgi:hypothetical protein